MNKPKQRISIINNFLKFHKFIVQRLVWPYSFEQDSLVVWRASVLSSILIAGLLFGSFALIAAFVLIFKENAWGLAIVDISGLILNLAFLFVHRIRFEIRASITLLTFFIIGLAVILSVGPLSGGPAWLFAFAVLAGVLMGNYAAFIAILMNLICISTIGILISTGRFGNDFPFFYSTPAMIAAGVNFIVLNSITAVSVSSLVKGLFQIYRKKEALANSLNEEKSQLIQTKLSLESEVKDRKKAEISLQETETLFRLITEHTSALVAILDSQANYIFASPSHERLGYKPEDLIGQSGFTMIVEEDIGLLLEHLEKAKHGKLSNALLNCRVKDKKGQIHHFRGSFDAVFTPDGSLERIICVSEDETQLRQAQNEKIEALSVAAEAKKLALVGQVAGKMAHDFNNILGIIMGVSELSLMDCSDNEINKNLELILNQTIRGKNLTKNLVAFAKTQEPKQEFFKINEKIDLVLNLMKKDLENIRITVDHGSNIPDVLADSGMIEHALVNLLQNSIHAVSKIKQPRIIIRSYCIKKDICFEIEDNGCGIPNEHLNNIYDPSFTLKGSKDTINAYRTDVKGTGYGMANVKKYIDQHKGKISVQSIVNSGTKFTFCLPVIKKELSIEEKTQIQKEITHFEKYILLVEDEPVISDIQYRILTHEPCNHKVDIANNGQVALDLFNRNQYDFISLDYVLPGNINGMDVYKHIRKINTNIPILFISGNIEFLESIKELMQKDTNINHLSKPCQNKKYVSHINRLLSNSVKS